MLSNPSTQIPGSLYAAQVQRILQGAQVPGTTKRQRRAIRHMHRQHPSCPPEAPFRCRNGLCVKDWTYCPDKLYR